MEKKYSYFCSVNAHTVVIIFLLRFRVLKPNENVFVLFVLVLFAIIRYMEERKDIILGTTCTTSREERGSGRVGNTDIKREKGRKTIYYQKKQAPKNEKLNRSMPAATYIKVLKKNISSITP